MKSTIFVALVLTLVACVRGAQICCPGLACYNDNPPFNDMPLPECPDKLQVSMRVYTRNNAGPDDGQVITRTTIPPAYDASKKTVVMVHGWLGDMEQSWMHEAKDALLAKKDVNVILTGWGEGAIRIWYPQSASNTRTVGGEMGAVVANIQKKERADPKGFWCIGHSLGGHTCGHMGKHVEIGRITGLDPAGPWFEDKEDPKVGVSKNDAHFVDIWHTNGEASIIINLGTLKPLGHVDFYPNGGGLQPGCIMDPFRMLTDGSMSATRKDPFGDITPACSHLRVVFFVVEAFKGDCKFNARSKCSNHRDIPGSCRDCGAVCQIMGEEAMEPQFRRGLFYLTTKEEEPFCKG